jgi:hypothetical protein
MFLWHACDDPSLDDDNTINTIEEPVDDLVRLSTIIVAQNTVDNIVHQVDINYDDETRVDAIDFVSMANSITFNATYSNANRLMELEEMQSSGMTTHTIEYDNNQITVNSQLPDGSKQITLLSIDSQNRIDRALTFAIDQNGNRDQIQDKRLRYTQNFNVSRIDNYADNGFTITSYSVFSYNFNNNPFSDMNDVLRFIIFSDYIPYTRYLPASREDFELVANNYVQQRSITYAYELMDNNFPSSREVSTTANGATTVAFETFNYLP